MEHNKGGESVRIERGQVKGHIWREKEDKWCDNEGDRIMDKYGGRSEKCFRIILEIG